MNMLKKEKIAVTNRNICYELYRQAGLTNAEDTPLTCLSRQIRAIMNTNSYDKILVREKDLNEEAYRAFITNIFSAQSHDPSIASPAFSTCASAKDSSAVNPACRIILHSFPAVANQFGTDLHLPFSAFTKLFDSSTDAPLSNTFLRNPDTPLAKTESIRIFHDKYPHIQRIGTSVHSIEDAIFAEARGADYITAGHIFATDCKKGLPGRGIDWLKSICDAVSIPVYAIGGISEENVPMLSDCKIAGYCMMSESMHPISSL